MRVEAWLVHGRAMAQRADTPDDLRYVTSHFAPLAEVARPGAPFGIAIPEATYELPDGSRWFARDVWRLADDASGADGVRALFARRHLAASEALGEPDDLDAAWSAYLAGLYGACLREVTPETIVAKQRLVRRLEAALAAPRIDDPSWCARLRADVEALDGLEKPFASCDRARFGPTTRDRLIAAPRARFAAVFACEADRQIRTAVDPSRG
jgi:hypothetical protein